MTERDQLRASLADRYTIERELGGGGMSLVFLARETALGRPVVVKMLTPDLAAGVSADRFIREIATAARLQQANIVPLLSSGEADGIPWYSMPYVSGESLRAKLTGDGVLCLAPFRSGSDRLVSRVGAARNRPREAARFDQCIGVRG